MKLLATGVLLYGLWAVARCSDPGMSALDPMNASGDTSTTVPPLVTMTASPDPTPYNITNTTTTPQTPTTTTSPVTPNSTTTTTPSPTVPVTNLTTLAPSTVVPPTAVPPPERHFDTLSFLGGIILTLGCLAICYVAFKFYKARTERNYHTL